MSPYSNTLADLPDEFWNKLAKKYQSRDFLYVQIIVSGANATKVILYDKKNRFYMGSAYEYFNLNDMELCTDAIELQYDGNLEEITNKILSVLKGE